MIRKYVRACFILATLGWDWPILRWWLRRPRVVARRERRRAALRIVFKPVVRVAKLLVRLVLLPIRFVLWR